ncbi:hypothetical protein BC941DRAFT_432729 [Chlamydoabsidia padenii]|nr:hypothetical protein BC941DRAFT_432729 [Chlamydoabsidia padenii]
MMRYLLNHWSDGNHCRLQAMVKNLKRINFKALRQKLRATPEEKRWGDLDTTDKFQEEAVAKGTPLNCCEINGFAWNNSDDNGRMYTTTRNMARQKAVHKRYLSRTSFQFVYEGAKRRRCNDPKSHSVFTGGIYYVMYIFSNIIVIVYKQ